MTVVFVVFAVIVIVGAAFVLTGRWDPGIRDARADSAPPLPQPPIHAADIRSLRFRVGLRGYRMQDVDAALAALADELDRRDGHRRPAGDVSGDPTATPPAG
ncbi:MAG: DivIVA domain-containing protein [Candidatus Nanopelagicales bacterium]